MITTHSCDTFHILPKHTCTTFAYLKLPVTNNWYKIIFNVNCIFINTSFYKNMHGYFLKLFIEPPKKFFKLTQQRTFKFLINNTTVITLIKYLLSITATMVIIIQQTI